MKRFFTSLATFSLLETIGRHPAIAAGVLTLLGLGGGAGVAMLFTPTITPQPSAYFDMNSAFGVTNNALKPNNGVAGALELPTTATNSFAIYVEGSVDPNLGVGAGGTEYVLGNGAVGAGLLLSDNNPGQPAFLVQRTFSAGGAGTQWWNSVSASTLTTATATRGSGYATGLYPFTATGGACAREPTGVWPGNGTSADIVDPGFNCSTTPTVNPATIPGDGAQQATGAGSVATSCVSNSPVSGEMTVTAHVALAHGLVPGQQYTMQGLTPTGYNATYTALPGTSGTTLIGETTTGAGTCPAAVSAEGTALSGTGATITMPGIEATFTHGETGITTHNAQHFCGIVGEYGADSPFPGAQFASFVDEKGNPLPGAPALVPWLNQGTVNFTGYTTTATQDVNFTFTASFSGAVMTVTGSPGGTLAVGQTIAGPNLPGGVTISSLGSGTGGAGTYNMSASFTLASGTYTAHTYTPALTVTALNPYTITNTTFNATTGYVTFTTSTSPGFIPGSEFTVSGVSPSGYNQTYVAVAGTSGTNIVGNPLSGPVGTLQAISNPGSFVSGGSMASVIMPGMQMLGDTPATIIAPYGTFGGTGTGGVGTYGLTVIQTGALGSSGAPINIFAWPAFYYSATTSGAGPSGGVTTVRAPAILGDFVNFIGSEGGAINANHLVWGGAIGNVAMLQGGPFPQATGGAPSTTALSSLCKKQTDIQSFAATNGLTVRSLYRLNDPGIWADSSVAQFTGAISGTALTISSTQTGSTSAMRVGTVIAGIGIAGCPSTCPTISSGSGNSYALNTSGGTVASETMTAGVFKPAAPLPSNNFNGYIVGNTLTVTSLGPGSGYASFTGTLSGTTLTVSGVTGTIVAGMVVTDGGASLTGPPLIITAGSGTSWTVASNYYPTISGDAAMVGTQTTLVPGQYVLNSGVTIPVKVIGYGTGTGGVGTYMLSNNANGSVGSSGSPVAFTSTGISDGGAVAPGPALTIHDLGPGATFPVTNYGAGTGALSLSGTYDTSALGGAPSVIQAQVSTTAGGPPVSGCAACAWTNLSGYSATLSSGTLFNWSGQALNIPGGGPYYVSVRAANGTAYATLPNLIKVGLVFDWWGEGQLGSVIGNAGGIAASYFTGLWGGVGWLSGFDTGPPLVSNWAPSQSTMVAGNRFGISGSSAEGVVDYQQDLTNAFGWPVMVVNIVRDGVGITPETMGNALQMQTIGVGNATLTTWCSQSIFCSNTGQGGTLTLNGASLTGWTGTASISGTTLSIATASIGALEPNMILSGAGITGSPTLVNCTAGCSGGNVSSSTTWTISVNEGTIALEAMTAAPSGGAPWSSFNIQVTGVPIGFNGFGAALVQAGTFKISVNGTTVCQDSTTFAYNNQGGNCTGAGISSSFVNYSTGDYEVTFSSPPANTAVIIASWTNIVSPGTIYNTLSRPHGLDWFGNGSSTSGPISSALAKTPGGVSGHVYGGGISDGGVIVRQGYPTGAVGYTQMVSWLYDTRFPNTIPGVSASTPFISANYWRGAGAVYFNSINSLTVAYNGLFSQWAQDVATKSTFSGTIASNVLTLTSAATGPMWEGEVIGGAGVTPGAYILNLASGSWGASGSTYNLGGSPANIGTATAMQNAVYYLGPGPAFYAGPMNDNVVQASNLAATTGYSPHPSSGFTGGRRIGNRLAALTWGGLTNPSNASDPTLSRAAIAACDGSAIASPCFDVGNTYAASASGTISGSTVTFTGGLPAHARPFVVGQALSCTGCTSGRVITAVSAPPTQSTVSGAGQIGNTFTITANGSLGVSTTETVTAGCSGTAGTGSNCIDVSIQINTGGTYGTAAALATCGANNLNGSAANYNVPTGVCRDSGVGGIVRNFRIGTQQATNGFGTGTVYDDGVEYFGGSFNQSAAFTCNIVAATIVQCVKGAAYTSGVVSGVGQWATGHTFVEYGDSVIGTGRIASLLGYVGGQSFPITSPGSSQTPGVYLGVSGTGCGLAASGVNPKMDITVGSGGTIVNAYPANAAQAVGLAVGSGCTFTPTGTGGTAGSVTVPVAPVEGVGGISTMNTDSNTMGVLMYDNSGFPGNPLNSFFTNGQSGYFEPGLPVQPWGEFQGAAVSG